MNRMFDFNGKTDVFMIDPPWAKKKGGIRRVRPNQGRDLDYETMPVTDVFALLDNKIFPPANPTHTVFMWTIEQYLIDCEVEMAKRGYRRHCRFVWDKMNGVAPAFTVRYSHEYLIWYYKRWMTPIAPEMKGKLLTVFSERPREHSRKPEFAYNMVERLYPTQNKLDVFSRENRVGWRSYGNQTGYFNNLD